MKAIWTAPYKFIDGIKDWPWPCEMEFIETYQRPFYLFKYANDYDVWFCNPSQNFVIGSYILDKLPQLRLIVTPSTGTNHIDVETCEKRGVAVLGLLDDREGLEDIRASSEFAFLMIMNSLRRYDKAVVKDRWARYEDELRGYELKGKQVGLIGYGRIGRNLRRWCEAFGAGVKYYDPYVDSSEFQPSMEWIFGNSDIVVVCCSLTAETRCMVSGRLLRSMRRGARLVNIARGEIIDEVGLVSVLKARPDLTFVSDVIVGEVTDSHREGELLKLPNSVITPHIGGTTYDSQEKAARMVLRLAERYLDVGREKERV